MTKQQQLVTTLEAEDPQGHLGLEQSVYTALVAVCAAQVPPWRLRDVLDRRSGSPEVRLRYRRLNGDLTGWLPSSRHADYWLGKGWVAVALQVV